MIAQPQQLFTEGRRTVTLVLPYPPSVNSLYRVVMGKNGVPFRVKTTVAKKFHHAVERHCRANEIEPLHGPLSVAMRVYRPRRIGDLDGTFKVTFDALKGWAMDDDKQIEKIIAERFDDPKYPRIEMEITEI